MDKAKALPQGRQPDPPGPPTPNGNNRGAPCAVVALHGGIKVRLAEKDKTLMTRCGQASRREGQDPPYCKLMRRT